MNKKPNQEKDSIFDALIVLWAICVVFLSGYVEKQVRNLPHTIEVMYNTLELFFTQLVYVVAGFALGYAAR